MNDCIVYDSRPLVALHTALLGGRMNNVELCFPWWIKIKSETVQLKWWQKLVSRNANK